MKALVLGLDHRIQYQDPDGHLESLMLQLHGEETFDLIAEEWGSSEEFAGSQTVGKRVADSPTVRIPWTNIEMPVSTQESVGISDALRLRTKGEFNEWTLTATTEIPSTTYLKRADDLRERYWLCEVLKQLPKESVLLTCGFIHVETFASKLSNAGFQVKERSLCEFSWYRSEYHSICTAVEKHVVDDRY